MPNILKKPKHRARLGHNGFDMSKRVLFTSTVGQLLPVLKDFLSPGEKISVRGIPFTRTQPMQTAAYTRLTEHIDYFFVPMKLIDSFFNSNFYGIQDYGSDLFFKSDGKTPSNMPVFSVSDVINALYDNLSFKPANSAFGTPAAWFGMAVDEFGISRFHNFIRLWSLLGYSESVNNAYDPSSIDESSLWFNLYPFFAYQKIFSDYYRLTDWQANNPSQWSLDKLTLNWTGTDTDRAKFFNSYFQEEDQSWTSSPLRLHYRPWKKDFFTNVQPTPFFTENSVTSTGSDTGNFNTYNLTPRGIYRQDISNLSPNQNPADASSSFIPSNNGTDTSLIVNGVNLSLSSIRGALAWEKMQSITMRSPSHYDAQTLAHFGFDVPKGISDEVYYLGSNSNVLQINDVVASATTEGDNSSTLGETAGRGLSVGGKAKTIKFTAPCHGYFMAIYSVVPESDYAQFGFDRINTYTYIMDYPHPELDNLGMQPLYQFQYSINFHNSQTAWANFLGWQYRWSELKLNKDTVHGAFNYTLRDWVSVRKTSGYSIKNPTATSFNAYADTQMFINPSSLNSIFLLDYEPFYQGVVGSPVFVADTVNDKGDASYIFARDPFMNCIDFKYYKSSVLSPYGLPKL